MDRRFYIITFLFMMQSIAVISQELKIQSFTLSPTEIIPSNEQRKDLNGEACALVKVQVVDGIDRVEGNIIGKIEIRGVEKRLYMTKGTKMFRLYPHGHLPVNITTSQYNIDRLESNRVYILRLIGDKDERKVKKETVMPDMKSNQLKEEPYQKQTSVSMSHNHQQPVIPTPSNHVSDTKFHFHLGLGFNAINVMGPSAYLGASYSNFHIEAGYVLGLDKVESITFTQPGASTPMEAYDYSCSKFWTRLGYSFGTGGFKVSPQAGVTFNMISGKAVSGFTNSSDYFQKSNPMSAFAAIRFSYEVVKHLSIHVTPQYDFSIGGDQVFEVLKQGDSKIKAWGEGFGLNAGIIYEI